MTKDVLYTGKTAYGKIGTTDRLISKLIAKYEYPAYSFDILFGHSADKETKKTHANSYWQRVPELDKEEVVL